MKTCFKVVKEKDGKLVSCIVSDKAQVVYQQDKWNKAPEWLRKEGKGPMVFETLDQATHFVNSLAASGFQIWECQYRCKINTLEYLSVSRLECGELCTSYTNSFPSGTMQVKQVKLIRRVL